MCLTSFLFQLTQKIDKPSPDLDQCDLNYMHFLLVNEFVGLPIETYQLFSEASLDCLHLIDYCLLLPGLLGLPSERTDDQRIAGRLTIRYEKNRICMPGFCVLHEP